LAVKDPANPQWQSDLAGSLESLGDVLLADKEAKKALDHYQRALKIRRSLASTDPANTEWERDSLRSSFKYGSALSYDNKRSKTLELFVDSLKAVGEVPKKHVKFAKWLLLPSDTNAKLLETLQEDLSVAQRLAEKDPDNTQSQDDLARSHSLVGELLLEASEKKEALKEYQEALRIREDLAKANASVIALQYSLALAHADVATTLERLSKVGGATIEARNAVRVLTPLASRWPRNFVFLEAPRAGENNISI